MREKPRERVKGNTIWVFRSMLQNIWWCFTHLCWFELVSNFKVVKKNTKGSGKSNIIYSCGMFWSGCPNWLSWTSAMTPQIATSAESKTKLFKETQTNPINSSMTNCTWVWVYVIELEDTVISTLGLVIPEWAETVLQPPGQTSKQSASGIP